MHSPVSVPASYTRFIFLKFFAMRGLLFFQLFLFGTLVNAQDDELPAPVEVDPDQIWGDPTSPDDPVSSPPVPSPRIGGPIWQPRIGQKIQVILDKRAAVLDPDAPLVPEQADIWDLDLFDTPKTTIDILHSRGKRVMCYLSVGGSESWRPDFTSIPPSDLGDIMPKWKGERYLNLRSPSVWALMQRRIRMAYEKGCDAIDPDNVDPFNDDFERGGGFKPPLTEADSINFLYNISLEAKYYGMAMGMKNAESILPNVTSFIQFAVNEECTTYSTDEDGCWQYEPFLKSGKPVFHFEYVSVDSKSSYPRIQSVYKDWANLTSAQLLSYYCFRENFGFPYLPKPDVGQLFSTAIKKLDLGGWVMYCDGSIAETPTQQTVGGPDRELDPGWQGKTQGQRGQRGKKGPDTGQPEMLQPEAAPLRKRSNQNGEPKESSIY
jgi:endo-alpha-1,4-polygalactosaminidase (GH114 family)